MTRQDNDQGSVDDQCAYRSAKNQFDRFREFWNELADSNSHFGVAVFFLRFDFLVCSKFNDTQCGRTCACAVACLCPQDSISNVVVSVTIHDDTSKYTILLISIHVNVYVYVHI